MGSLLDGGAFCPDEECRSQRGSGEKITDSLKVAFVEDVAVGSWSRGVRLGQEHTHRRVQDGRKGF